MLIRKKLNDDYLKWNRKWGAPYGIDFSPKPSILTTIPFTRKIGNLNLVNKSKLLTKILGMFAFERNNYNRIYEYPWAFYATPLKPSMSVLEIGGGFCGFQFVLAKYVKKVINIDPLETKYTKFYYNSARYYKKVFNNLNNAFNTDVKLYMSKIHQVKLKQNSYDRAYCLSVFEHLDIKDRFDVMKHVYKFLKIGGFFVVSVDLFLNIYPFSDKPRNFYGTNVSIYDLVKQANFKLVYGNPAELFGYPQFDHKTIMSSLDKYQISNSYPLLSQILVLQKI